MTVAFRFFEDDRGRFGVSGSSVPPELFERHFPYRSADIGGAGPADHELVAGHVSPSATDPALIGRAQVHSLLIYNAKNDDEILAFDRRITADYTAYYASHGEHYLGVYRVDGPVGLRLAEIVVYDKGLAEAQGEVPRKPSKIDEIEAECRLLQDREDARFVVWFEPKS